MLLGGHGNISVTANVTPRAMAELCAAAMAGDGRRAAAIHLKLLALHRQLFAEANPIPVKWALARMGKIGPALRLPLVPLSDAQHAPLEAALREAGAL
jgi:4-hydroxy-tetrahydrodipicolinate synthase